MQSWLKSKQKEKRKKRLQPAYLNISKHKSSNPSNLTHCACIAWKTHSSVWNLKEDFRPWNLSRSITAHTNEFVLHGCCESLTTQINYLMETWCQLEKKLSSDEAWIVTWCIPLSILQTVHALLGSLKVIVEQDIFLQEIALNKNDKLVLDFSTWVAHGYKLGGNYCLLCTNFCKQIIELQISFCLCA